MSAFFSKILTSILQWGLGKLAAYAIKWNKLRVADKKTDALRDLTNSITDEIYLIEDQNLKLSPESDEYKTNLLKIKELEKRLVNASERSNSNFFE